MSKTDENSGLDAGALAIKDGHTNEYQWFLGPTQIFPVGTECIGCGDEWTPFCIFEDRSFSLSKDGRLAFDRLLEMDGKYSDIRRFADWLVDYREGMKHNERNRLEETFPQCDNAEIDSIETTGGVSDKHINEIRFSGFKVMPIEYVDFSITGQKFEGSLYANLSLLIHAISFEEVRTGELRSNPELREGIEDIIWKCNSIMFKDMEGIAYYRSLVGECCICRKKLPMEGAILNIVCPDRSCHERIDNLPFEVAEEQ